MIYSFNPVGRLVIVEAEIVGPVRPQLVRLALDTAANGSMVDPAILTSIGYDLTNLPRTVDAATVSGHVFVPPLHVSSLSCLGRTITNFRVVAHRLPNTSVDGILGLDFLRGHVLTIDFVKGEITLTP